jgi:hypothetical protein
MCQSAWCDCDFASIAAIRSANNVPTISHIVPASTNAGAHVTTLDVTNYESRLERAAQRAIGGDTAIVVAIEPVLVDFKTACATVSLSAVALRKEMALGRINAKTYGRKPLFEPDELRRYAASLSSWEPAKP